MRYSKGKTGGTMNHVTSNVNVVVLAISLTYLSCLDSMQQLTQTHHNMTVRLEDTQSLYHPIVEQGSPVNAQDKEGNTLLHTAAKFNCPKSLKVLLGFGALIDKKNCYGLTPLHHAVSQRHEAIVLQLLRHGANPNTTNNEELTSLYMAITNRRKIKNNPQNISKQVRIVKSLLDYGADPNTENKNRKTLLHLAQEKNLLNCVRLLLQYGAKPNFQTRRRKTVRLPCLSQITSIFSYQECLNIELLFAIKEGMYKQMVEYLDKGAHINYQNNFENGYGRTALHYAVMGGNRAMIYTLLIHGADPTIKDAAGNTPIHMALGHSLNGPDYPERNILGILPFLIKSISFQDPQPLHVWRAILQNKQKEIEDWLKQIHPDMLNEKDPSGNSSLHMAALGNSASIVQGLLIHNADPTILNNYGQTALDFAKRRLNEAPNRPHQRIFAALQAAYTKQSMDTVD